MSAPLILHEDRLFPAEPSARGVARELYGEVKALPILSPHGHTDPEWFATNDAFGNAAELLLQPDHYLYRMLYSQGIPLEALGVPAHGRPSGADPREAWRLFAENQHLFHGTPSSMWLDHVFSEVFGFSQRLSAETADTYFDAIGAALATDAFRPRALFERFNIEVLATTEGPQERLVHHHAIRDSGWAGRVITAYRPDPVIDAEHEQFGPALEKFADLTGQDVHDWRGYLEAHRVRRAAFADVGATSTDHGHPTARPCSTGSSPATSRRRTPSCSAPRC